MPSHFTFAFILVLFVWTLIRFSDGRIFAFGVHHREPVISLHFWSIKCRFRNELKKPFHGTVGTAILNVEFTSLFDSGASFTYLVDPAYTKLSESFHSQARDRRCASDSSIPFEYCYEMSDASRSLIPSVSLTVGGGGGGGGGRFTVYDPIIVK